MAIATTQPTEPTRIACLQCQLLGRRKLTCTRRDACEQVPHNYWLGPVLLTGWVITTVAFILTVK